MLDKEQAPATMQREPGGHMIDESELGPAYDRRLALFEYDQARRGIEKYDDHLFRIRQWNIALTAAALAAIIGLAEASVGKRESFSPSLALFVYTAISSAFWLFDAFNKSLQTIHIHNARDIEKYLRLSAISKNSAIHLGGPSISLRFRRKTKRHWVGTVKNPTDESVILFYVLPMIAFWMAILIKFRPLNLCVGLNCDIPTVERILAIALLLIIAIHLWLSHRWKHGNRTLNGSRLWRQKYILRPNAAARRLAFETISWYIHNRGPCSCIDKRQVHLGSCRRQFDGQSIGPYRADFFHKGKVTYDSINYRGVYLFVDRFKVARDPVYLEERKDYLRRRGQLALHVTWAPWRRWPWRGTPQCSEAAKAFTALIQASSLT